WRARSVAVFEAVLPTRALPARVAAQAEGPASFLWGAPTGRRPARRGARSVIERQGDAAGLMVDGDRVAHAPRVSAAERDHGGNAAARAPFEHEAIAALQPFHRQPQRPQLVFAKRVRAGLVPDDLRAVRIAHLRQCRLAPREVLSRR